MVHRGGHLLLPLVASPLVVSRLYQGRKFYSLDNRNSPRKSR